MKSDFSLDKVEADAKIVFNHVEGRIWFNADIFWVKSSIGEDNINLGSPPECMGNQFFGART